MESCVEDEVGEGHAKLAFAVGPVGAGGCGVTAERPPEVFAAALNDERPAHQRRQGVGLRPGGPVAFDHAAAERPCDGVRRHMVGSGDAVQDDPRLRKGGQRAEVGRHLGGWRRPNHTDSGACGPIARGAGGHSVRVKCQTFRLSSPRTGRRRSNHAAKWRDTAPFATFVAGSWRERTTRRLSPSARHELLYEELT
ncbi:MAG: hypothetical protein ACK5X3_19115 [Pseudomonadota bacterium]